MPGNAVLVDRDGRIVLASPRFGSLSGHAPGALSGRPVADLLASAIPGETALDFLARLAQHPQHLGHALLRRRDSAVVPVLCAADATRAEDGSVIETMLVTFDEREIAPALDDEGRRSTHPDNLALVASMLGHDFNNMLTAMLGNIGLVRAAIDPGDALQVRLEAAEQAAERARDLTGQLLQFARGTSGARAPLALAELLRESARFAVRGTAGRCDFEIEPNLWSVSVDAGQIGQVLQNLVLNAVQAMQGTGTVSISAENVEAPEALEVGLPNGRYVRVTVSDTGSGIAPEHRARIFDPFFSTKPHGAGLGLSAAYSIIQKHDGRVTVDSQPGAGTRVSFWLPAITPVVEPNTRNATRDGRRRILVMDDEPLIREVIGLYLERQGYEPVLAREGAEAIAIYQDALGRGERFDAVVMDLTVPGGMGGAEAIRHLRLLDPAVRAIVASGYSNDPIMTHHQEYGFIAALSKPFRATELSNALSQLLAV